MQLDAIEYRNEETDPIPDTTSENVSNTYSDDYSQQTKTDESTDSAPTVTKNSFDNGMELCTVANIKIQIKLLYSALKSSA